MNALHNPEDDGFDGGDISGNRRDDNKNKDKGVGLNSNSLKQAASVGLSSHVSTTAASKSNPLTEGALGSVLKNVYRDALEEEVPDSFMDLLNRLD